MSEQLVECVPNFSEGRDSQVIGQIAGAIESVDGVRLMDVDIGPEMNRTVVTFVGGPAAVAEAAFRAIEKASELIDMRNHSGSHPRMGATDVCPLVPVSGVSVDECIHLSNLLAKRVGEGLGIPVFLYEESARCPERRNLADVRVGEYEGLEAKLADPGWKPDYGPSEFNPRAGATVIGVREFLIAYNINLNTREAKYATDIAFELRAKGRSARRGNTDPVYLWGEEILKYEAGKYPCGEDDFTGRSIHETVEHCRTEHDYDLTTLLQSHGIDPAAPEGESVKIPGTFAHCKAIGWFVPEYDRAQVSINLTNYRVTAMQDVLEETRKLAAARGLVVTGSEIVGMVPYDALLQTGLFYLRRQGRSPGVPISDILATAVQSLGLTDVAEFNIEERVLGLPVNLDESLVEMKVSTLVDEVSRESAAPGGGSIAALAGALGASLASMVANLTANKRGSAAVDEVLNEAAEKCQRIKFTLIKSVDDDADAFNAFMDARRLPKGTPQEVRDREIAMQDGLKKAVEVPLQTARLSLEALEIAEVVARTGNPSSITDVGVGANIAFTGVKGGVLNVLTNLKEIEDETFVAEVRQECADLEAAARKRLEGVDLLVAERVEV